MNPTGAQSISKKTNPIQYYMLRVAAAAGAGVLLGLLGTAAHPLWHSALPSPSSEGEFPSLDGAITWLNSPPLTHAGLRGKVVLVQFWTYTCVNWLRTLPYVRVVFTGPDGKPAIGIAACYCSDVSKGAEVIAPLRKFGAPLLQRFEPMPYSGLFSLFGPPLPNQRGYHMKGSGVPVLSDGAIDAILDSAESATSPFSQVILFTVHGAAARVGATETAFSLRQEHVEIMHLAAWEKDDAERHVQWSRRSSQAMQPFASQRAYVNFLEDAGTARVRAAYGPIYERLVALKIKYDPKNLSHLNQNIQPDIRANAGQEEEMRLTGEQNRQQ